MQFKVLSFDMFQTLVDVNAQKYSVWSQILKESYSKEKAEYFWEQTLCYSRKYSNDIKIGKTDFQTMKQIFKLCYQKLFEKNRIIMDPDEAINILFKEHGRASIFQDAKELFSHLKSNCRIFISSDSDTEMIQPLLSHFQHEHVFISEKIKAYKQNEQGKFFNHILDKTNIKPTEILHIGDGLADVIGAKRSGIPVCWINRHGKKLFDDSLKPTYIVQSLMEIENLFT